jgi:uncharacterized membrane protein YkvA (DUF1232 family)
MNKNTPSNIPEIPGSQGFFHQLALRIKLFFRMMKDPRSSIFLKASPLFIILYLISPIDLVPFMPLDDAAVISLAFYLFIELSPKDVIDELMEELRNLDGINGDPTRTTVEIIEGIITNKKPAQDPTEKQANEIDQK